jgi:N-acyl-D-amino-acid deacylase
MGNTMADVLIRNGKVIDGSGSPGVVQDVLLEKNRIVEIGHLGDVQAGRVIDAAGMVVCPGFIDIHSHVDATHTFFPETDSFAAQGITTVVTGNCGFSDAPKSQAGIEQASAIMGEAARLTPFSEWDSFGSYLDFITRNGVTLNVFPLVGQGTIRTKVMGYSAERPDEDQIEQMQELVIQCMEEGAGGLSTGLIYSPGSFSFTDELIEVTRPVGKRGGIYFSHVRGEAETLLDAIAEEITIGKQTGAAVQHCHFKAMYPRNWDKAARGLEMIDAACADGIDMTADMYPYTAGSSGLIFFLPQWAQEGGIADILSRVADPTTRAKMAKDMDGDGVLRVDDWSMVMIPNSANPAHIGRTVAEMAADESKSAQEWVFDAILETKGYISCIMYSMSEDNLKMEMRHPRLMFGTDGIGLPFEGPMAVGAPHPRNFGTYPRFFGKYVRQEKVIPLEEAVWKATGFPAQKLRLKERGLLRKGYKADLVIFNPDTILDTSDYIHPYQRPVGIEAVFINGVLVMDHGVHTKARPGVVTTWE